MLLHHTLGNGDFNVFKNMSTGISCFVAELNDPSTIAAKIDQAISECYIKSRPVYLTLPTDMVQKKVEGANLSTPLDLKFAPNDVEAEDYVVDVCLRYLTSAKSPIILVDACAIRHRALDETRALVQKSGLPTFVTPMGKGAINETWPNYCGVYAGDGSPNAEIKDRVESADLIIYIGALKSDFNTSGFTVRTSQMHTIDFHSDHIKVRHSVYPGVRMNGVLSKLVSKLPSSLSIVPGPKPSLPENEKTDDSEITHSWLWPALSHYLKPKDIVLAETGTSIFGIWGTRFPADVTAICQVLWGSIGYATGACAGAALAAKETTGRRTILFTGDGSFQLTAQEVSTMIRRNLTPIIFVIVNDGYEIERQIHDDPEQDYNSVQNWRYKDLPAAFGAEEGKFRTYQIKTRKELSELFADGEFAAAKVLQVSLFCPSFV